MEKLNVESQVKVFRRGHTYVQWTVGLIANSVVFSYGMQAGWVAPMGGVLQAPSSPLGAPLTAGALGWVASVMPITALLFVPVFSYLADKCGRKTSLIIMVVPLAACWLLKLLFASTTALIIARICAGIPAGGCFTVVPMYNKEISQDSLRGLLGSMLVVSCNLGLVVVYALGAYLDYYTVLYVASGLPILTFVLLLKCPESPGFLVKMEKYDEAVKTTAFLRGLDEDDPSIRSEIDVMRKDHEYYKTLPALSIAVIMKDRAWRKAFTIAMILTSVQAFSGNFALVSFGAGVLAGAGAAADAAHAAHAADAALAFPAVMTLSAVASMLFVDRVGRKVLLIASYLVSAAALGALGALLALPPGAAPRALPLAAALLSMAAFAAGVMPLPYIIMSEMFNIQIRATLMGLVSVHAWSLSFVQLAAFAPVAAALGAGASFHCYAAAHLLGAAAALALLPETRGKSVDEIETELRNK